MALDLQHCICSSDKLQAWSQAFTAVQHSAMICCLIEFGLQGVDVLRVREISCTSTSYGITKLAASHPDPSSEAGVETPAGPPPSSLQLEDAELRPGVQSLLLFHLHPPSSAEGDAPPGQLIALASFKLLGV